MKVGPRYVYEFTSGFDCTCFLIILDLKSLCALVCSKGTDFEDGEERV